MATFVQEGLRWWLDPDFARFSTPVLQILAIGVFISSLAQVFATLIQRVGRPDVTVALPLVELPIYSADAVVGGAALRHRRRRDGLDGVFVDAVLLFWFSRRFGGGNGILFSRLTVGIMIALGALLIPLTIAEIASQAAVVAMVLVVFAPVGWLVVLNGNERTSSKRRLRLAITS